MSAKLGSAGPLRAWRGADSWAGAAWRQIREWSEAERHRFIHWAPVLMIVGVAGYLALPTEPWIGAGSIAAALSLTGWTIAERRDRPALRQVTRAVFFAAFGFALVQLRAHALAAPVIEAETPPVTVEGILEVAERQPVGQRYTIRVIRIAAFSDEKTPHRVRVSWRGQPTAARPGDTVRIRAVLSPPPGPALPGGYDYARQLWFERIGGVGYSYGGARVIVPATDRNWAARVEGLRERVADRVEAKAGEKAGPLAAALVTGKRERVPDWIVNRLRDTGLAHLLAISGLHMGLVCGFVFFSVRLGLAFWERAALEWPIKKIAAGVAMAAGAGYLVLSGAPVSAQRAFIMAAVTFGAVLFDRRAVSLRNVALAALAVLVWRPEAAASAGFQMSFMAVTVLVAAYSWWDEKKALSSDRLETRGRAGRFLGGLFATSFLAGLATGPFAAYHFGRIAVWGLPANMAVMPVVTIVVMPCAVAGLVLMPLGLDAPLWWIMGRGLEIALAVAGWFEALPGAVKRVAQTPPSAWLLLIAGMLWLCLLRARWRVLGLLTVPIAAWLTATATRPDIFIGRDARQAAVSTMTENGPRLSVLSRRRERFAAGVWMEQLGIEPVMTDQPKFGECGGDACQVSMPDGGVLVVAETPEAAARACRRADIVVYAGWRPASLEDCPADLFTAAGLARSGPVTIADGYVRTVAAARGCRPWTRCASEH